MKKLTGLIFLIFAFLFAKAQTVDTSYIDGIIYTKILDTVSFELVPYDSGNATLNTIISTYGIDSVTRPFPDLNTVLDKTYRIYFSKIQQVDALINDLQLLPFIEYAEKAPLHRAIGKAPNDLQANQWGLPKINALLAWDLTTGSQDVVVAIVDNAVRITHNDLKDNLWINNKEAQGLPGLDDDLNGFPDDIHGWDAADSDNDPNPPSSTDDASPFGHGTHCAGITSATTDNARGIASIGYNIKIMGVKCASDNNSSEGRSMTNTYDGVYYATRAGADIISMSWGSDQGLITGQNIMDAAHESGIVLVAAAGNDNSSAPFYPAAFNHVISVGSTNESDLRSSFSNYGATVDVMAPGSNIYSTLAGSDDSYGNSSGTSMACPLVAGLAGLVLSVSSQLLPDQVETAIKNGCDDINLLNPSYAGQMGAGRINAYKTLNQLTAIEEHSSRNMLIYPNPAREVLFIQVPQPASILVLEVLDLTGRVVFRQTGNFSDKIAIPGQELGKGIFFVKVNDGRGSRVERVVVL